MGRFYIVQETPSSYNSAGCKEFGAEHQDTDERIRINSQRRGKHFLQQRSVHDIRRNALVSVFLRQLEYYQGILLLTTNLLDQCDLAFESEPNNAFPLCATDYSCL